MCTQCGGKLKTIALIEEPDAIYRILKHCNLLDTDEDAKPAGRSFSEGWEPSSRAYLHSLGTLITLNYPYQF